QGGVGAGVVWLRTGEIAGGGAGRGGGGGLDLSVAGAVEAAGAGDDAAGGVQRGACAEILPGDGGGAGAGGGNGRLLCGNVARRGAIPGFHTVFITTSRTGCGIRRAAGLKRQGHHYENMDETGGAAV